MATELKNADSIAPSASAAPRFLDGGDPLQDVRQFRGCLAQFATGVTIITTSTEDGLAGVTANSFSSLSLEPPLILWSIGRTSRSFGSFAKSRHFAINILGEHQIAVSQHFSSKEADKFAGSAWRPGRNGVPLIDGAIATLECSVEAIQDGGDHVIIVGRVENYARYTGNPLLFVQGRYGIAEEHPEFGGKQAPPMAPSASALTDLSLLTLLFRAYHQMSAAFDEHRRAEAVTLSQGRTMAALHQSPGVDFEGLMQLTYLGQRDAEDAVIDLQDRDLLMKDSEGRLSLTKAGTAKRLAISRHWSQFQAERLKSFSESELDTARSVLTRLIVS